MTMNVNKIYKDNHASKLHKYVKRIMKNPLKLLHWIYNIWLQNYLLQSIVIENNQIEWEPL